MNFTERYELRKRVGPNAWDVLASYETDSEAHHHLTRVSSHDSGNWRVVRVMEVTTESVIRG